MSFLSPFRHQTSLRSLIILCGLFLFCAAGVPAHSIEAKITVISPARVVVEGKFLEERFSEEKNWTFLQSYADVGELGKRIFKFELFDAQGGDVGYKKFAPGIYTAKGAAARWRYEIDLRPAEAPTAAAHVSWLLPDGGLLMPEDLLPRLTLATGEKASAKITLELPEGWKAWSADKRGGENEFEIDDVSRSVLAVGKNWRESTVQQGSTELSFLTTGEWQFSDEQALGTVQSILEEHARVFNEMPAPKLQVVLAPFPKAVDPGRWRAETRGASVVIISSRMPFKSQAIQRLYEQLRHEVFHLWIPNKLALSGNYDWFFEGFTLYRALRTGRRLNQIRFADVLDVLGRAYTLSELEKKDLSLIEASKRRWEGNFDYVNSRGMIVAFLCDLALLRESRGRRSLTEIFREIYDKHDDSNPEEDGTKAILATLRSYPELKPIVDRYIEGKEKIDLAPALAEFGLEAQTSGGDTTIKIKPKLTGRQKSLLVRLGLNLNSELPERGK
jgi:predicted metalloprotease with PDZ domain